VTSDPLNLKVSNVIWEIFQERNQFLQQYPHLRNMIVQSPLLRCCELHKQWGYWTLSADGPRTSSQPTERFAACRSHCACVEPLANWWQSKWHTTRAFVRLYEMWHDVWKPE
jgi:hypothetical protein